jgi:catalase
MLLSSSCLTAALALSAALFGVAPVLAAEVVRESPASMVKALHTAFGEHHARAVHTKGVMFEGEFTPDGGARALTKAPIFAGPQLPIAARFSLFAGVPDLADNDDAASPAGFGVKIKGKDGDDFDIEANQHKDFITATADEFAVFLRALPVSGPAAPHPNAVEQFLAGHPHAAEFLGSRTYPASYAQATYFGINSVRFTNAEGKSVFVRYRFTPKAGERYLSAAERKAKGGTYLHDEIAQRIAKGPVVFDWYAQIAEAGDKIEDPSIAWPESRRLVKLGTFTLTRSPTDPDTAQRGLLFLPGKSHPGVEAADSMLVLRNAAYPISFKERQ